MYQSYGSPSQYGMAGSYGSATPQQPSAPQHQGTLSQVTPSLSPRMLRPGVQFVSGLAAGVPALRCYPPTPPPFSPAKRVLLCE